MVSLPAQLPGPMSAESFILLLGGVASFGAGPWAWWGHPGPCGQALALSWGTLSNPTGFSPASPHPGGLASG